MTMEIQIYIEERREREERITNGEANADARAVVCALEIDVAMQKSQKSKLWNYS